MSTSRTSSCKGSAVTLQPCCYWIIYVFIFTYSISVLVAWTEKHTHTLEHLLGLGNILILCWSHDTNLDIILNIIPWLVTGLKGCITVKRCGFLNLPSCSIACLYSLGHYIISTWVMIFYLKLCTRKFPDIYGVSSFNWQVLRYDFGSISPSTTTHTQTCTVWERWVKGEWLFLWSIESNKRAIKVF